LQESFKYYNVSLTRALVFFTHDFFTNDHQWRNDNSANIVPDAPERIKWVVSGENAVIISWLPPRRPNGLLTHYTVYIRMLEQGQDKIIKNILPAQNLHHEATDLKLHESYEAWVTASTKVGQGSSTPVVKFQPSTTGKPVSKFSIVEKFLCSPFVKLCRASEILFLKSSSLSKFSKKTIRLSSMKCKSNIRAKYSFARW